MMLSCVIYLVVVLRDAGFFIVNGTYILIRVVIKHTHTHFLIVVDVVLYKNASIYRAVPISHALLPLLLRATPTTRRTVAMGC